MIVTYFRSSSFNAWDYCPHSYYLRYGLGLEDRPFNNKADKGNIVHKALELLGAKKLAIQNGESSFTDLETNRTFQVANFTYDDAIKTGWDCYTELKPTPFTWTLQDFQDCTAWMHKALNFNNGEFNPLNREIVWPEKYFDFTIDEPWAKYSYELEDGTKLEGQLALKGTVDLVCKTDVDEVYEMVDWKTGKRLDWATGKEKDYNKLRNDPQLRIYHYALSHLLPKAQRIYVTIVFINDGGPFALPYDNKDLTKTENMLRQRMEEIRDCKKPKLIYPDWKCSKLCHFGTSNWPNSDKTKCRFIKDEIIKIGLNKVTSKYGNPDIHQSYTGGGVSNRDLKTKAEEAK